ncbi:MAG: SDR family oxidoreductase [Ignavibacteria bacterium]|jgi:NAD(P)-dependent dehydrogenase (short-subunit alcohol dehydrogenase family)|nr:SDR family oxidoreductase [Ignavibacteria bacterium]
MKRNLLVFGATGELGRGIVSSISLNNFDEVFLFGFSQNENLNTEFNQVIISDLSIEKNVIDAFANVVEDKNNIYFMVSTVGGYIGGKQINQTPHEDYLRMINMNLTSNFLLLKHFATLVKNSKAGSACIIAAYRGLHAKENDGIYGASKAGLIHLIKTASLEGNEINLTVNAIAPLIIDTEANRSWMKNVNFETLQKPKEIGELIWSLFDKFHFINGNIIELTRRLDLK